MSCATRDDVLKLAESKLGDLVKLTSQLIQIPVKIRSEHREKWLIL